LLVRRYFSARNSVLNCSVATAQIRIAGSRPAFAVTWLSAIGAKFQRLIPEKTMDLFALILLLSVGIPILLGLAFYLLPLRAADPPTYPIERADNDTLHRAIELLEHPSLAGRLSNLLGAPVEMLGRALPTGISQAIATASTKSLEAACKLALLTIQNERQASSQLLHKALVVASGAAGGVLGIASLPLELPVSTIIILRSILDIARSEGENLIDPESVLSCLAVLGLAGRAETDDPVESGYFARRERLTGSIKEAAVFIAERGVIEEGSPVLAQLIAEIASQFGFVVSEKATVETIPVVGALGGAVINYAFIDHFQSIARGHFSVRRLERKYGKDIVFAAYQQFRLDPHPGHGAGFLG
jgi:hypothetical protein